MKISICIGILLLGIMSISCFRTEQYPDQPQIEFVDFVFVDTIDNPELLNRVLKGTLRFTFIDGDGDIGFDTTQPQQNTIFLEKYEYVNGNLVAASLEVDPNYYVPYFESESYNSTLKGEFIVNDIVEYGPFSGDTIVYKFYIVDRAGNVSNVETTGDLILL